MSEVEIYPEALTRWRRERGLAIRRTLAPRSRLTVSQWADTKRILSREASAEPGQWSTDRTPYLREIMDCFSDPAIEQVVFMKSARIGGTECGNNVIGYFIEQDPSPMLAILPTVDLAKGWSKEQIAMMIRDTDCLRDRVREAGSRDSGNTIQQKIFPGGILTILGANSGSGFRMRSVRIFYGSEVDGWPESAGTEGDPVRLGIKRTETFPNRKIYLESTPLLKYLSRIETAYNLGDRREYYVPCPDCGRAQTLKWVNLKYQDLTEPCYACEHCGSLISEEKKYDMVRLGRWVAGAPFDGTASFRINALYSPFDGARWPRLVKQWHESQNDNAQRQQFVNQVLGETWEMRGGSVNPEGLATRCEKYKAEVPAEVAVLTAGVDVQADRLELGIKGWGVGLESWLIGYKVFPGDPGQPEVWRELDKELFRAYEREGGGTMTIRSCCVDTGYHASESVYKYVKPRESRRVMATKGSSTDNAPLLPRRPTINNKGKVRLYVIGTNAAKGTIYSRLRVIPPPDHKGPLPLYCHFPEWADDVYFAQLTAEKAIPSQVNGRWVVRYICPPGKRNEALDVEVLCLAAYELCGIPKERLEKLLKQYNQAMKPKEPEAETGEDETFQTPPEPVKQNPWTKKKSNNFMNWKRR